MPISADVVGAKSSEKSLRIRRTVAYVVLVLLVFISLFPFWLLIVNATRSKLQTGLRIIPDKYLIDNLKLLFKPSTSTAFGNVFKALFNSLIISGCASLLSVYFSALTAYAIHVYDFRLKRFAHTFILVVMMVPTQASAIGFYRFMKDIGLEDNYIPLIIPAIAAPAVFYFMKQYMDASLPLEIVEAARIDGCAEFRTFNSIVRPILMPAFAVQMIFAFVTNWNNYFMPRLILSDKAKYTVPLVLAAMRNAGPQETHAGLFNLYIVIAILPVVIVYLCLSKYIIGGMALGAVKG